MTDHRNRQEPIVGQSGTRAVCAGTFSAHHSVLHPPAIAPMVWMFTVLCFCSNAHCLAQGRIQTPTEKQNSGSLATFRATLATAAGNAEKEPVPVVRGLNGWLFFAPELRALTAGPFWGRHAVGVSRATNPKYGDPLEPIVAFHEDLRGAGIELLLVPVPAKIAIYPEEFSPESAAIRPATTLAPDHAKFYALLKKRGVAVLDLTSTFLEHRSDTDGQLFCRTDSHWSGRGALLAARSIAARIGERDWLKEPAPRTFASETRPVEITGDLARWIDEKQPERETVPLTFVGQRTADGLLPVEPSRDSPVLLIGDSHTLVFHDADLHARGAGLPDHLALLLGHPVDLVGVRGSGATATRIALLRRGDQMRGKRVVIWCLSFREFTESSDGWRTVPVLRAPR